MLPALSLALGLVLSGGVPRAPQAARTATSMQRAAASSITMSTRGVVITGGAGGVGYAYADSFMQRGHWVVICDVRDPTSAVEALRAKHDGGLGKVFGTVCDVSDAGSVEALADFAKEKIGIVHYWINNAGINGGRKPFTTLSTGTVEAVVKVNLIGVLICTKVALQLMQEQDGVTSHVSEKASLPARLLPACAHAWYSSKPQHC
jgi:chlorophyll(ide) b reductase